MQIAVIVSGLVETYHRFGSAAASIRQQISERLVFFYQLERIVT